MAFNFKDFSKKVSDFADKAAKKTGEVTESAKLNIALKTEQNKLNGLFTELGKLCYEKANGADVDGQVSAMVIEIDGQKAEIARIKDEIAANSGKVYCSGCGKEISAEAAFCPLCGAKQEPKEAAAEAEAPEAAPEAAAEDVPAEEAEESAEEEPPAGTEAPRSDAPRAEAPKSEADGFVEFFNNTVEKYSDK